MKSINALTVFRIIVGLVGLYSFFSIISGLFSLVTLIREGVQPEVLWVYSSYYVANFVLSIICIFFMLRGNLPAARRQAGMGFVFLIFGGFTSFFLTANIVAIIGLNSGTEVAFRISLGYLGAAVGGIIGLYLYHPSSTILDRFKQRSRSTNQKGESEDLIEVEKKSYQAENLTQSNNASISKFFRSRSVIIASLIALIVSICGCLLTHFSALISPCLPPETHSDSGGVLAIGTINFLLWIVTIPFAILLGGILGFISYRYLKLDEKKTLAVVVPFLLGLFSGLVFIIINAVLFHIFLCSEI